MGFFSAQLISAIKLGSIYALVAIGYSIVYSIMGMINFAHGELLMVATFALWVLSNAGIPFGAAVVVAIPAYPQCRGGHTDHYLSGCFHFFGSTVSGNF